MTAAPFSDFTIQGAQSTDGKKGKQVTNRRHNEISSGTESLSTAKQSTLSGFKKSKHYKPYTTVLSHVGFNLLCGLPTLTFTSIANLSVYYYQSRNIRMTCSIFLHLTSLINPILTMTNIQVYKKTFQALKAKCTSKIRTS